MGRSQRQRDNNGGSLLATVLITGLAAACCMFIAVVGAGEYAGLAMGIVAGVCLLLIVLTVVSRLGWMPSSGLSFYLTLKRSHREDCAATYEPRKAAEHHDGGQAGNQPISVNEVREIKETSANVWVPAGHQRRSR
ncbi:MAG: hypothetical protein KDA96_09010 [Planctomycetaceae bacterium]|nr:hypothetical protein [Planctomycetaceae bacterium]